MADKKCPLCDNNCLLKVVVTEDERFCEVDACSACGTMYPRDKGCGGRPDAAAGKDKKG
jgi:hypothetical protein